MAAVLGSRHILREAGTSLGERLPGRIGSWLHVPRARHICAPTVTCVTQFSLKQIKILFSLSYRSRHMSRVWHDFWPLHTCSSERATSIRRRVGPGQAAPGGGWLRLPLLCDTPPLQLWRRLGHHPGPSSPQCSPEMRGLLLSFRIHRKATVSSDYTS